MPLAALTRQAQPLAVSIPLLAAVGAATGALGWVVTHEPYDTWGGLLVGVALTAFGLVLVRLAARAETDPRIVRLLHLAFLAKMGATVVRLVVVFGVYDGAADAEVYHEVGRDLAGAYRAGDFSADVGSLTGTGFVKLLTGLVYAGTGATRLGGFFVFSFLGFWGLYCFYRAFRRACPEGDGFRFALLVFLLPSLLFWPSSIGKEAWMTFTLGLAALGAARVLTYQRGGLVLAGLGLAGTALVRPHVGGIFAASLLVAYLLRRPPGGATLLSPIGKLAGVLVLGVGLTVVVHVAGDFLHVDTFNRDGVAQVLQRAETRTGQGQSVFDLGETRTVSPASFPAAVISVLFRPFPFEAHNPQAMVSAVEGTVLFALFVASWRRLVGAVRSILRTPYVVLCCCYGVLFVYGFSAFANFGILTRQRVQVLPMLLVLLALPPYVPPRRQWRTLLTDDPSVARPDPADRPSGELAAVGR